MPNQAIWESLKPWDIQQQLLIKTIPSVKSWAHKISHKRTWLFIWIEDKKQKSTSCSVRLWAFFSWPFSHFMKTVHKIRNSTIAFTPSSAQFLYTMASAVNTLSKVTKRTLPSLIHHNTSGYHVQFPKSERDLSLHLKTQKSPSWRLPGNHFQVYFIQNKNSGKFYEQMKRNQNFAIKQTLNSIFIITIKGKKKKQTFKKGHTFPWR